MRELSRNEHKVLIVVAVGDATHAVELNSMTTLCGIPLDHPALAYPAMDTVTHDECLRLLATKRVWDN